MALLLCVLARSLELGEGDLVRDLRWVVVVYIINLFGCILTLLGRRLAHTKTHKTQQPIKGKMMSWFVSDYVEL